MRRQPLIVFAGVLLLLCALTVSGFSPSHASAASRTTTSSHATAQSVPCPPTVQKGSSGSAVGTLQTALNELFNDFDDPSFYEMSPDSFNVPLQVDESFGPQTLSAVIDFQTWNSPLFGGTLVVDGVVGPHTWHVLHKC
jgi:peptidoglycan hydrolase-like protein with peptidoglycan-binding domain